MKRLLLLLGAIALAFGAAPASAQSKCEGSFVNPITDVCWGCMFPLSLGSLKIWPSSRSDTDNPDLPICACGTPVPRVGLAMGFWEPARMIDVTTKPFCFPNLGGIKLNPGFNIGHGEASNVGVSGGTNSAKYHVHYYIYPLLTWMEILTDFLCFEQSTFDIAYITEIDPLWQDDELTTLLNPEAAVFANPIAQAACAADCIAATAKLPLDELFWCSGCQGPMYPMNGNIGANVGMKQSGRLAAERMVYKMHRTGLAWGTSGSKALCSKYIMPVLKKSQYRIQQVNPTPMVNGREACSPIGATTILPRSGKTYPVKGEDMGFLLWRKRNCCVL